MSKLKKKNKSLVIKEYGIITCSDTTKQEDYGIALEKKLFSELENLIIKINDNKDAELSDFLTISSHKTHKKIFKVQNYVGVIQLRNGISIEILPKIYFQDKSNDLKKSRELLLKMLRSLKNSPFKKYDNATIRTEKLPVLEIFIKMFLEELSKIIKSGLKADYIKREENQKFLKGKLKINQQILYNSVHKERFFVQYDEYLHDIAENRLIKSTLFLLASFSNNIENQKNIRLFLSYFTEVKQSLNYEKDFAKCSASRLFANYEKVLRWCSIFLQGESFLNYKGSVISYALLFPMEKLFESYVADKIKKKYEVFKTQHQSYYLARNSSDVFSLRPDIFAKDKEFIYLMDTKWKHIYSEKNNYGISPSDMYQMLSYAKIYEKKEIVDSKVQNKLILYLIYPRTEFFREPVRFIYHDVNSLNLRVLPFDLETGVLID